jgi:hypothetical protein
MDEAFHPMHRIVEDMIPAGVDFTDDEAGVHSYMTRLSIESPVELDVTRRDGRARDRLDAAALLRRHVVAALVSPDPVHRRAQR